MHISTLRPAVLGTLVLSLAACGGGGGGSGGGTANSTLSVPSQMTIVEAQDQQSGNLVGRAGTGTDYDTDPVRIWVHDDSMGPLETINNILCSLDQTGYQDPNTLNAGPYIALIEITRCEQSGEGGGGDSAGGQTDAGQSTPEYEEWTVESTRASDTSEQVVKFWIDWDEDYGPDDETIAARLYGKLTIFESPSEALPYGRFKLDFKLLARTAGPTSQDMLFRGTLGTSDAGSGVAEYTFYMENGDVDGQLSEGEFSALERARVRTTDDGVTGRAFTSSRRRYHDGSQVQSEDETFHVTFNADYLARKRVAGNAEVKVFDRNDFDTHAWRYGLYDATSGDRVELESGFPIRGPNGEHGWAGHWGVWFPEEMQVTGGMTVTRERYGDQAGGDPETYTVFVAPGRMMRRTRTASTLGALEDEEMHWWNHRANTQTMVKWLNDELVRVANWSDQEQRWMPIDPPQSIMDQFQPYEWTGLWSDGRGEVNFTWPQEGEPTDATEVTIWVQDRIDQSSSELANGDLALLAYQRALRSNLTRDQATWQNEETPYLPDVDDVENPYDYTFVKSTLTLMLDGQPVTYSAAIPANVLHDLPGLDTGPMVTMAPQNVWELHESPVAYRWETGPREWNQLRLLLDADDVVVEFDRPMAVEYTHDQQGHRMHGKSFRLEYAGDGNLHGIPNREDARGRWYPLFTIPTGTIVPNNDGSFRVKILEAEQTMVEMQDPQTVITNEGLDLDTELSPPTDTWQEPGIGAKPDVTDPPLFVGGVYQATVAD